jgi:hypothetical protein
MNRWNSFYTRNQAPFIDSIYMDPFSYARSNMVYNAIEASPVMQYGAYLPSSPLSPQRTYAYANPRCSRFPGGL